MIVVVFSANYLHCLLFLNSKVGQTMLKLLLQNASMQINFDTLNESQSRV